MESNTNNIREFCERLHSQIPAKAWNSSVVIVRAAKPYVIQLGTGTLFAIADRYFLITAAHVVHESSKSNQTLGIGAGGGGNFVALSESAICSNDVRGGFTADAFDVAIVPLTEEQTNRLDKSAFLRLDDVSFSPIDDSALLSVFGFPHLWSTQSGNQAAMTLKALQFTTDVYCGPTLALSNYADEFHILLNASSEHAYDMTGMPAQFETLQGHRAEFPADLKGISGCSVWTIGLKTPTTTRETYQPKLVAVQTGIYTTPQIIKSTRWIAVTTLFHEAFPELRPAMSLIRSG